MKWTDEQLAAIEARECNLLVAAAAGAGKTAVLVQRIIDRIIHDEKPIDIDNMLVVTFTNAAAAEMKERIGEALHEALEKEPQSQRLQRQILLLPKAGITTIHSFCMDVVKNNYHTLDLDPDFRVADETEGYLLQLEAIDELFEKEYEEAKGGFLGLLDSYSSNRDDEKLKNMIMEVYNFIQSTPWPEQWVEDIILSYRTGKDFDFSKTEWARVIMEFAQVELRAGLDMLKKAEAIASRANGLEKCQEQLKEDITMVELLFLESQKTWNDLFKAFKDLSFSRQKIAKDGDEKAYEKLKVFRKEARDKINKLGSEFFTCSSEDIKGDMDSLYPLIEYLGYLVLEFKKIYMDKKKEKGLVDFSDLEHFSLEILTDRGELGEIKGSSVAFSLRDKYAEILIDEYQDSNMVQEVILNIISKNEEGNPNIFMVGDVKQSIYRFRQAKPELFLDKYLRYSEDKGSKERKIKLFKNFRSGPVIIDGVNCLFRQLMTEYVGEINYDQGEYLNYAALYGEENYNQPPIELHILDLKTDESEGTEKREEETEEEALDNIQAEARLVAKRIKDIVEGHGDLEPYKVFDKELQGYRNIEYKDIAILLRTVKGWSETFVEELEYMGIPVFADTATGYFKRTEVQVVLSLLQIIDNPLQDIPLISVLRSPIGGFSSEELLEIRLEEKERSFYDAMKTVVETNHNLKAKVEMFLSKLESWRKKALYTPTDQLIWYLLQDTGYMGYVGAMPQGRQRQANLRLLFERAKQYEDTSFRGLFNFINFIEKIRLTDGDMGNAKILGEKDNVVRIMSIHKSKGLEFPVVILSGAGKKFNLRDTSNSMLLHHELGLALDFVDVDRRISYTTVPKMALKHKIKMETLSEEMRILYVALTRARERLIITGYDNNLTKTLDKWVRALDSNGEKLPTYMVIEGNKYLNWIGYCLIRHKNLSILRDMLKDDDLEKNYLLDDSSQWEINLWKKGDLTKGVSEEEVSLDMKRIIENIEMKKNTVKLHEEIVRKLQWSYPHKKSIEIPVKVSVTELKRIQDDAIEEDNIENLFKMPTIRKPKFMEEEKTMTGAEKGSIMHYVMQHLDLSKVSNIKEIQEQVDNMVVEEFLTEEQAKVVDTRKILMFFQSPLGERLKNADNVYREVPFNIEIHPKEVFQEECYEDIEDRILLQGIIDCYFVEKNKVILLDYKTDYIKEDIKEHAIKKYKTQIKYYTKALEIALGRKVDEKYIYFFNKDREVSMN